MREETGLPYESKAFAVTEKGERVPVMHGCGHDSHIACALAAAELLAGHRHSWKGTIVFVFQPGEEIAAGATRMVDAGLWKLVPTPEVILAQHLGPFPAGTVEFRPGSVTSLADALQVKVHGKGAHGSQPESAIDPIVIAAFIIVRLQTVVSRGTSPLEAVVVTVGTISGGLKENIIPSEATFTINIRTPNEEVRNQTLNQIRRIVSAEAASGGAPEPDVEHLYTFPRCYNDPQEFATVSRSLAAVLGSGNVTTDRPRSMASEDFGWLGDSIGVPTVFWWYGAYAREGMTDAMPGNHSPYFAPDAVESTVHGIRSALAAILGYLGGQGSGAADE
jgi:hippurate hydrolase